MLVCTVEGFHGNACGLGPCGGRSGVNPDLGGNAESSRGCSIFSEKESAR